MLDRPGLSLRSEGIFGLETGRERLLRLVVNGIDAAQVPAGHAQNPRFVCFAHEALRPPTRRLVLRQVAEVGAREDQSCLSLHVVDRGGLPLDADAIEVGAPPIAARHDPMGSDLLQGASSSAC